MTDPGLEVLGHLLDASHDLAPDQIVAAVARAGRALDAEDVAIYLVDYQQTLLVPLPDGTDRTPLEIDTTLAGRAFAAIAIQEADAASRRRLWLPLLDGAERLGVLSLTLPRADDALRVQCSRLATLVAELLMTKGQYTDSHSLTRRRQPMGLAAEMQWQLLPPLTFVTPQVVIAGLLEPAYEVAGDAFDYALNGDTAHLAVIDPVGHDLTATVLAAVTVGSYRHSRRAGLDLADTYAAADQAIASQFGGERFVTGQLAQLDCVTGQVQLAECRPSSTAAGAAGQGDRHPALPPGPAARARRRPTGDRHRRPRAGRPGAVLHRWSHRGPQPGRGTVRGSAPGRPAGPRDAGRSARRRDDAPTRPRYLGPSRQNTTRRRHHGLPGMARAASMNLSSQRYRTQNTWPDRCSRTVAACTAARTAWASLLNRALGGRRSIHRGPFNLLVRLLEAAHHLAIGALLSSDDFGSSVERTGELHP
jgi:hypothetical protein